MSSNWKQRYFVLSGRTITYFEAKGDLKEKGNIVLELDSVIETADHVTKKPFSIGIFNPSQNTSFVLFAQSQSDADRWLEAFRTEASHISPFDALPETRSRIGFGVNRRISRIMSNVSKQDAVDVQDYHSQRNAEDSERHSDEDMPPPKVVQTVPVEHVVRVEQPQASANSNPVEDSMPPETKAIETVIPVVLDVLSTESTTPFDSNESQTAAAPKHEAAPRHEEAPKHEEASKHEEAPISPKQREHEEVPKSQKHEEVAKSPKQHQEVPKSPKHEEKLEVPKSPKGQLLGSLVTHAVHDVTQVLKEVQEVVHKEPVKAQSKESPKDHTEAIKEQSPKEQSTKVVPPKSPTQSKLGKITSTIQAAIHFTGPVTNTPAKRQPSTYDFDTKLGIGLVFLSAEKRGSVWGLPIVSVVAAGKAAGLNIGDFITHINTQPIPAAATAKAAVALIQSTATVKLTVEPALSPLPRTAKREIFVQDQVFGMTVARVDGQLLVVHVSAGGPAEKSGVVVGDAIESIGDVSVGTLSVSEFVSRFQSMTRPFSLFVSFK
eukprot:c6846_g1_i1.p1 GENE.c6846_g1_i1~~c6846_g1_i1.p1  ORF type:complete len:584 (-),score=102.95 c6846_g1_i1:110-1753(-)